MQALAGVPDGRRAAACSWDGDVWMVSGVDDLSRPLRLFTTQVPPEWVDYNGHVHESRYLQAFGDASDAFFRYIGVDAAYLARAGSYFTAETHLSFVAQTRAGDSVGVTTQLLGFDEKRLHLYHVLTRQTDGAVLAEAEHLCLHVDTRSGRVAPAEADLLSRVGRVAAAHAGLARPVRAGTRSALFGRSLREAALRSLLRRHPGRLSVAAVDEVAEASRNLLTSLETNAPPRNRAEEAAKARARAAQRFPT